MASVPGERERIKYLQPAVPPPYQMTVESVPLSGTGLLGVWSQLCASGYGFKSREHAMILEEFVRALALT